MDFNAAVSGIGRDLEVLLDAGPLGWVVALLIVGLPILSAYSALVGNRPAAIPLAVSVLLGGVWVLYYALDWPNPGLAGAIPALAALVIGWAILLVSFFQSRRRHEPGSHSGEAVVRRR